MLCHALELKLANANSHAKCRNEQMYSTCINLFQLSQERINSIFDGYLERYFKGQRKRKRTEGQPRRISEGLYFGQLIFFIVDSSLFRIQTEYSRFLNLRRPR